MNTCLYILLLALPRERFQVRGGAFQDCTKWNVWNLKLANATTGAVIYVNYLLQATVRSSVELFIVEAVVSGVQKYCQCDLQSVYLSGTELLCDEQEPNWVLLAADIIEYGEHSTQELVGYIQDWVTQGATSESGGLAVITFDKNCPVGVHPGATASCLVSSPTITCIEPTVSNSPPSLTDSGSVCIPFLIVIAMSTTVTAIITILVCVVSCLLRRHLR